MASFKDKKLKFFFHLLEMTTTTTTNKTAQFLNYQQNRLFNLNNQVQLEITIRETLFNELQVK